jgi:hypothetical protein
MGFPSRDEIVPLRLLVCLGLLEAVVICFVLFGGEAGLPRVDTGRESGESRIVEGDGILIVSMPRQYWVNPGADSGRDDRGVWMNGDPNNDHKKRL